MTSAWRKRWERFGEFVRTVIGAPRYEQYVAHLRTHHPERVPLPLSEFTRAKLSDRYDKPGSRCC